MSDNYAVTPPRTDSPSAFNDRLIAALRGGNWDEAGLLVAEHRPGPDVLRPLGDLLMRRRRWAEAAWVFDRAVGDDAATAMKRRLSGNLAALKEHRPDVYESLVGLPTQQHYTIAATASGQPTILHRRPDGAAVSLSSGPDPLAAAASARQQVGAATKGGESVGLCGVGDGYLLQVLAHNPPALFMDKQQPVFVIEPEAQLLLQCLMIHDYAGASGPIEQARFHWFVGEGWGPRLGAALLDDLFLPGPTVMVGQSPEAAAIQATLRAAVQVVLDRDTEHTAQVDRRYASFDPTAFERLFEADAPRRPRVLLLTTRFSTVLQFSTRDAAASFERLGWEARVVIEPTPHHRVLRTSIRAALAEFEPDLVFQIDHLRHEHNGLFPAGLPFACWIQDHLPQLATREAGSRVGLLDFVLTDATATYADKFGYPPRQCLALPKLTVDAPAAPLPPAGSGRTDDVVFVSNASGTPEAMLGQGLAAYGQSEASRALINECGRRMIDTYASGGSLPTYASVCAVLRRTLSDLGLSLPGADFDVLARWLTHPFNDALYRQQALRWAAEAAGGLNLSLGLYGTGWERHPEFAPFARGPVGYGDPLRQLTRRSRINLQIVPYLCLHQRLLDGLMAGGFFLVRTHPADLAPAALLDFVNTWGDATVRTTHAMEARLLPEVRGTLAALLDDCRPCIATTGNEDLVAMVRDWQEAGQLVAGVGPLPRLDETAFGDAATLRGRLERFADAPELRWEISDAQRRSIAGRLTYDAGLGRVVRRMRGLLRAAHVERQALSEFHAGARAA